MFECVCCFFIDWFKFKFPCIQLSSLIQKPTTAFVLQQEKQVKKKKFISQI